MILRRLAATVAATVLLAGTAWAQSSALPYADTTPNSTPTIPFGGIHTPTNSGKVATAASLNNAQDVLSYITDGESPNEADYQGHTAFMYAAMSNNTLITRILLDHGARVELKDKLGNTALHDAAQRGSIDVMRLLIAAKAPIDAQNREGVTPLMLAANSGRSDVVALLLQNGADPAKQDYTGRDAAGWAGNKVAVVQLLKNPASTPTPR
jgi:ankyrin repeat protein